ncbi:MAG: glutamate-cysteine ligase family protein [Candidatus Hodarchaeota archaeon]
MELQVVNKGGDILRGEELIDVWNQIFKNIVEIFENNLSLLPSDIRVKVKGFRFVTKERQGKHLPYLEIEYENFKKSFKINVIGPDPNISQITWIMELVTPPCISLHEFAWWNTILNKVLLDALPEGYHVLPLGLNPKTKNYMSGVTYGEHYHIGVHDSRLKLSIYNILRNYLPHLIALTVNSPFIDDKPTGVVKVIEKGEKLNVLGKDCIKSLRLHYNKAQMGPVDKDTYIPCLEKLDPTTYREVIRRKPPDDRFTDIYPFTEYGTIELRVFDTQFSLFRRLAIVSLLEALCLKAKKLVESKTRIPCVKSAIIVANREKSILFGLHGKFSPDTTLPKSFATIYNEDPLTGTTNGKMFQAVKSLFYFLKVEIKELQVRYFLQPFHVAFSGTKKINPPVTPADYLLFLYDKYNADMAKTLRLMKNFQSRFCANAELNISDPVMKEWGAPTGDLFPRMKESPIITEIDFDEVKLNFDPSNAQVGTSFKYFLDFSLASSKVIEDVEVLVLQQLIETRKKSEIVLFSKFKTFKIRSNENVSLTHRQFPFIPDKILFVGNKQCRGKFVLKLPANGKEFSVYSNAFWLELAPRFNISSDFRKKKISSDDRIEIKYKITRPSSDDDRVLDGKISFQVLSAETKNTLKEETTPISLKNQATSSFKLLGKDFTDEKSILLRMFIIADDKIIARHESGEITIDLSRSELLTQSKTQTGKDFWPAPRVSVNIKASIPPEENKLKFSPKISTRTNVLKSEKIKTGIQPVKTKIAKKSPAMPKKGEEEEKKSPTGDLYTAIEAKQRVEPSVLKLDPTKKEKIATLFSKNDQYLIDELKIPIPFSDPEDRHGFKLTIDEDFKSSKIIAQGNKLQINYIIKKFKIISEEEPVQMIAFLINQNQDVLVILKKKVRLTAVKESIYKFSEDVTKHFRYWKPTKNFYLVFQIYQYNALIGESICKDLQRATFTTSSQIEWKKVTILQDTIYPSMDAAFELEFNLKALLNPITITIAASCQDFQTKKEILVEKEGPQKFLVPFRIQYQKLTPIQNGSFITKIFESGMMIKDQKKVVAILPRGPLFVIKDVQIEIVEGLENVSLLFNLINDGKTDANCQITVYVKNPSKSDYEFLGIKNIKLKVNEEKQVEINKLRMSLSVLTLKELELNFLVKDLNFPKSANLLPAKIERVTLLDREIDMLITGKLKNLDNVVDIKPDTGRIALDIEIKKHAVVRNCKAKLIELTDGLHESVIKTMNLPDDEKEFFDNIYWKPPIAKDFPMFCKLELRYYQGKEIIGGAGISSKSLFFFIYPE